MKTLLAALLFLAPFSALSAVSTTDRALVERGNNLLVNGGFESGKAQWTASGGTFTTTTTAANLGKGSVAGSWNSSGAAQTLTSTAVAIPAGLYGRNGVASCIIQGASATHTLQAYDGSNILASTTITSQSEYARTSVNFIFPSSGNISLRLVSVAADEPTVYIDDCYLGDADGYNISQISQANLIGSAYFATTANCTFTRTNTALGAFSDADCPGPTVEVNPGPGVIQTTDANAPVVTVNNLAPGTYVAHFIGQSEIQTSAQRNSLAINDGTTTAGQVAGPAFTSGGAFHVTGVFTYSVEGNRSFQLYGSSAANAIDIVLTTANQRLYFYLERFPTSSEIAYRADLVNWKVDANISGSDVSLGTSAQTSYVGAENGSLTLTNNSGRNNLTAQIPCSSTNAPTGTTCSVGNESVGVSFTIPQATDVQACVSFAHQVATAASGRLVADFQIVETASNAQTVIQEGKGRVESAIQTDSLSLSFPHRLCGTFTFASAGQKTLRLMYEQSVTATVSTNTIRGDAAANNGQRDIHWEVYPINQATNFPSLVGSVTSSSTGQVRTEVANINCDAGSAITSQIGSWVSSIGNISGGACAVTLATGAFSSAPYCFAVDNSGFSTTGKIYSAQTTSATALSVDCEDDASGACSSFDANIQCIGPK